MPRSCSRSPPALGDDQPGPSQRLSRLSPRVADRGFAPAPDTRLPVGNTRGDAALRRAGIPRPRVISRLARAGASDRDAGRAALKQLGAYCNVGRSGVGSGVIGFDSADTDGGAILANCSHREGVAVAAQDGRSAELIPRARVRSLD